MNSDLKLRVGVKRRLESSAAAAAAVAAGLRAKHHRSGSSSPLLSPATLISSGAPTAKSQPPASGKVLSSATIETLSLSKIRQLVFNMSMCKLSRYRQTADPSLVRSVLICNTLKRLERELDREGIKINFGPNGVSFVPPPSNTGTSLLLNNHHHNSSSSTPPPPQPQQVQQENLHQPSDLPSSQIESKIMSHNESNESPSTKFSMQSSSPSGRLTPFLRQEGEPVDQSLLSCQNDDDSGLWSPDPAHRLSSSSWTATMSFTSGDLSNDSTDIERVDVDPASAPPETSILLHELRPPRPATAGKSGEAASALTSSVLRSEGEVTSVKAGAIVIRCSSKTSMDTTSPSAASTSSSTSSSTTEEIFGDIDLSLYDFDLLSPIAAPSVKLTPVTAEELIRSIAPAPDDIASITTTPVHPIVSCVPSTSSSTASVLPAAPSPSSCPSTSCATQSTASVVFSKLFISKKDPHFLDDMPTAIS